jgi:hypothetical protein
MVRYSFPVGLFHSLLHAGLSRRTDGPLANTCPNLPSDRLSSSAMSFAQTVARALGINTDGLRICIAENRIVTVLLKRFTEPKTLPILRHNRARSPICLRANGRDGP